MLLPTGLMVKNGGIEMYWITIERPVIKEWRGHKVPFILYVRLHYPTGSRVWFNLIGPNFMQWAKGKH